MRSFFKRSYWYSYPALTFFILLCCIGADYFHIAGYTSQTNIQQFQSTPVINNIKPTQVTIGKPPKKLVIDGSGFQSGAMVEIDGARFDAKIAKQGQRAVLQTRNLPALLFQQIGNRSISVVNPDNSRSNPFIISVVDTNSPRILFQELNPVVNEGTQLQLRAQVLDAQGNVINNAPLSFETGSPEIATIDQSGMVRGVLQGFATITARSNNIVGSVNLTVTRVNTSPQIPDQGNGEIRVDLNGNVYITDLIHHVLRRGQIAQNATIFAGNFDQPGNINGQRLAARLNGPLGVAIDNSAGFIYIADSANHVIRRLNPDGVVETIAGFSGQSGSQDGPLASATFSNPRGVAIDRGGNIYVSDTGNNTIRFIDLGEGVVRTVAGLAGQSGLRDGQGSNVRFAGPQSIVLAESRAGLFSQGQSTILLIADTGNKVIRSMRISDLVVSTVGPAPKTIASEIEPLQTNPFIFNNPSAIGRDDGGNIYVCDNGEVRVVTPEGELFDLAGDNSFNNPTGVATLGTTAFVLDGGNSSTAATLKTITVGAPVIRQVTPNQAPVTGGVEIVVEGSNFSDETRVLFDGVDAQMLLVESATRLRLIAPAVNGSGTRTLTIFTRGGIAQSPFTFLPPSLAQLNNGEITTFAGGTNFVGDGGNAIAATLGFPTGLAVDAAGKVLVADVNNQRVRRIDIATGIIISIAGTGTFGGGGDDALSANLTNPADVAIDSDGNIFTTDFNRVIKISGMDGKITTVAGGGFGDGGDGGQAAQSQLGSQLAIAIDSNDNLYIADAAFNRVRRIDADTGIITNFAGVAGAEGSFGGDNGPAINARLNAPFDIAFDLDDNLFIADRGNSRVRRVDAVSGTISTVAGNGTVDFSGDGGLATAAAFTDVRAVALDGLGNLFIVDRESHRIRVVDADTGVINTIAGNGADDFGGDGGDAKNAALSRPTAIVLDGVGNLFIADGDNNRIRMVDDQTNTITTIAGTGLLDFAGDNTLAVQARLFSPQSILFDNQSNLIIADTQAGRIRSIDSDSLLIQTIAGTRPPRGFGDDGPAKEAFLGLPTVLATDASGNLLVLDTQVSDLRRINRTSGVITRVAGSRQFGFDGDGSNALMASFANPTGLAIDRNGNIFIADTLNHRVRRIDARTNVINTIVGTGVEGFAGDGGAANAAQLSQPGAMAFDPQGNLYISDLGNRRIRRVDLSNNTISTFVGGGNSDFAGDGGAANQAAISIASAITFDRAGNLFFSDQFNNRVRRVDARTNVITSVVGNGEDNFVGDGNAAINASLSSPNGLVFDDAGNLFIADQFNDAVRVVKAVSR